MIGSAARGFRLTVEAGDELGTMVASAGELVTIGRGGTLALADPAVHCAVETRGDRVVVRDLGSAGGARLDGVEVLEACARHGSVLAIGSTRIRIELGDAVAGVLPGDDLVPAIDGRQAWRTQRDGWMRYAERKYVESALIAAHYNVSEAAKLAGMNRASFYRM